MKVFISWSGTRSEEFAKALREWFPLVLHYVEPWLSQSDIQAGERWSLEVAKELEACNFGVLCVTRENLASPWILFEAGALAKSMQDGRVIPLLLDLDFKEISGPLAQFQAKKADNAGIKELVASLNKACATPVPDSQLDKLFVALWADLERQIAAIPKGETPAKQTRPQGEILEELVSGIRNVEIRVREAIDEETPSKRRRKYKHQNMFIEEMIFRSTEGPSDPLNLLLVASLFRDEAPWLYELAVDAYRALQAGNHARALKPIQKFAEALDMFTRSPLSEDNDFRMPIKIIRHEILERFLHSPIENKQTKTAKVEPAKARAIKFI